MMKKFGFNRTERLKSSKVIGRMFKDGISFGMYPLRLVFLKMDEPRSEVPVQFTVSVPKKSFKSAVARNKVKRKIREAWRLNKNWLYHKMEKTEGQYAFMVIYIAKENLPFEEINKAMRGVNNRFVKKNIYPKSNPSQAGKPLS